METTICPSCHTENTKKDSLIGKLVREEHHCCPKCNQVYHVKGNQLMERTMKFKSWKEYLDEKGKTVEKPKVTPVADYDGPDAKAPETAGKPKPVDGEKTKYPDAAGKPAPYKPATAPVDRNKGAAKDGLADKGDGKLVYKPDTVHTKPLKNGEEGKPLDMDWHKNKAAGPHSKEGDPYPVANKTPKKHMTATESFLEKTSDMPMHEFAKYILSELAMGDDSGDEDAGKTEEGDDDQIPMVTSYAAGKFHPHPPETIEYLVSLMKKNPRVLEHLLHALKRKGMLDQLLKSAFDHPEAYDHFAGMLDDDSDGDKHASGLARAMGRRYDDFVQKGKDMFESVAPPFGQEQDDEEQPEDQPEQGDEAAPEDAEQGDQPEGDEPQDDQEDQPEGDEPQDEKPEGDEPEGDQEDQPEGDEEEQGKYDPDNPDLGPDDYPGEEAPPKEPKPKRSFGHDRLFKALGSHPHIREKMKAALG